MKTIARSLILALPLSIAAISSAQQQTFNANPSACSVAFALSGTGHEIKGTFHVQSGSIQFDRGAAKMSGLIVVSSISGESGEKSRDKKMQSDVLESPRFADVTFAPQSYQGAIAPSGDSTIQVSGAFTLHGASHDLTVPMQVHIDGTSLTATGTFVVPYVKWGLKDPSMFILKVAKEVQIDLKLSGTLAPAS